MKRLISKKLLFLLILSLYSVKGNFCFADKIKFSEPVFLLNDSIWRIAKSTSYADYWRFIDSQGYSGLDIEMIDREGNYYFHSATLEGLNWVRHPDTLYDLLKELKEDGNPFKFKKPEISLNLSTIAQRMNEIKGTFNPRTEKLSSESMKNFILDLQLNYNFSDLTSQPFPYDTQTILQWSVGATKTKLNMGTVSPIFEQYLYTVIAYKHDLTRLLDRFVVYDFAPYPIDANAGLFSPTIGLGDLIFALGRTLNKEIWFGTGSGYGLPIHSEHNLFLYRTLQYAPAGFLLLANSENPYIFDSEQFNFKQDIQKNILEFYHPEQPAEIEKKPIANLVLSSLPEVEAYLPEFIEPIMNALLLNGYEIKVTFGEFFKGAEVYYVVNSQDWSENPIFFDNLLELMDYRKSRFYGKVILHPMGEIVGKKTWKKICQVFKIPPTEGGWIKDLPSTVHFQGQKIFWKGTVLSDRYGMTFIQPESVRSNSGEIVLSEVLQDRTFALILKSGNHFFINGNFLHLEAGYFLSRILGDALQNPTLAYVTSNRDRIAAWAVDSTSVKIKIPAAQVMQSWRLIHFNRQGRRILDFIREGKNIFEFQLRPYELVILFFNKNN